MSDQERQDLSSQVGDLIKEMKLNTAATNQILRRLDGEVGKDGTVSGGLCELVKSHDRYVKRRERWDWAAIVALMSAIALVVMEKIWK